MMELPENTDINKHAIKLVKDKQLLYGPIYSLKSVELKILKTYIETYLKTRFIWPFKSLANALIFFDQKLDRSLHFCINYQGLNNLTMKNWYLLPLIRKALNRLVWVKYFTQLDLTNAYHRMRIRKGDKWKTVFYTRYSYFKY